MSPLPGAPLTSHWKRCILSGSEDVDEVVVDDVVVGVVEVDELVVDVEVVEDVEYVVVGGVDMVGDACWWT